MNADKLIDKACEFLLHNLTMLPCNHVTPGGHIISFKASPYMLNYNSVEDFVKDFRKAMENEKIST